MKKTIFILLIGIAVSLSSCLYSSVSAYEIENLDMPVENDIVLGPGKIELQLDPGQKAKAELIITNRMGKMREFTVEIEDFKGSHDPQKAIEFMGEAEGPYSLKNYLSPEISEFVLSHGQRIRLPFEISIPEDAEPGGLYGAVLVSASDPEDLNSAVEKEKAEGQMKLITRIASLVFIRVNGEVTEDGFLQEFKISEPQKLFYEKSPISFEFLFQNNGNVHLSPYGKIEIINLMGKKVGELEVDPYFAMPDSLRKREIEWDREHLFGRYTATLFLNRNYVGEENIIDQKTITFWVFPWKIVLIVIFIIIFLILLIRWFFKKFKFELKKKENTIEDTRTQETIIKE